ncbi:uncharacterized protein CXorf51A-like [Kogia breviceps]|uniref:uncharacterized protein CXorf51A-like n=1 Tax=Kogia breviceps TaxID=27615 RepID=UPI0034D16D14
MAKATRKPQGPRAVMDSKLTRNTRGMKEKTPHQKRPGSRVKVAKATRRLKRHLPGSSSKKASPKSRTISKKVKKAKGYVLCSSCSKVAKATARSKRHLPGSSRKKASRKARAPSKKVKKAVGGAHLSS